MSNHQNILKVTVCCLYLKGCCLSTLWLFLPFSMLGLCRRFTRVAQEDFNVCSNPRAFASYTVSIVNSWVFFSFHVLFAGVTVADRVPLLLSLRVESVGLQLCEVFAFYVGCFCCLSCSIHHPSKTTSLGKHFVLILLHVEYFEWDTNYRWLWLM